jgi:hypothetical protein
MFSSLENFWNAHAVDKLLHRERRVPGRVMPAIIEATAAVCNAVASLHSARRTTRALPGLRCSALQLLGFTMLELATSWQRVADLQCAICGCDCNVRGSDVHPWQMMRFNSVSGSHAQNMGQEDPTISKTSELGGPPSRLGFNCSCPPTFQILH